jgi:hypothetical protein
MTRAERKIEAAKRKVQTAKDAHSRACARKIEAEKKLYAKYSPAIWKAARARDDARKELTIAELEARGVTPLKTILQWKGELFCARLTRVGYYEFLRVGQKGRIMKNRASVFPPWNWDNVRITDKEVVE